MADPSEIVGAALRLLADPARPRVLVTAGRTEEAVDPVRFLSNRSSGRMGCAIAEAARHAGYPVTLICGPMSVEAPAGVEVVRVVSAREMLEALHQREGEHEILIMAAAVADYRPAEVSPEKLPGGRERHSLELVANPDILASLRGRRDGRVTIGFALETGDGTQRAREKLRVKGCDLIVLNHPLRPGSEFGGDTNEVTFLYRDGRMEPLPLMSKLDVGREILARAEIIRAGAARSTQGKAERQP